MYDVLVIGAGQAAMPLIFDLAKAGKRVALVERKHLGGSCVNFGCTPTKAVIASARVAHLARRAEEFGLKISTVEVDFAAVLAKARAISDESRDGLEEDLQKCDNPALLRGNARLVGKTEAGFQVQINGEQTVTAKEVVLDTGTRSKIPDVPGLKDIAFLHAGNWLDHTVLPEHLILLGAGYIGLEMAQFYRRMGSRVTVIDHEERLLPKEDQEVSELLQQILESEGIVFQLNSKVEEVQEAGKGVRVTIQQEGKTSDLTGTNLFVATGRTPNTEELGLETVGLTLEDKGIVPVNERLETPVKGLWAVGDIRGGPMFTHTSWDDYRILMSQMTGDGSRTAAHRNVPYAVFTDPALGRVGITEQEARQQGKSIQVGRFDVKHNGHMRTYREERGFIKVVVDADTGHLLGASLLCDDAGELLHIYQMLMNSGTPYSVLCDAIIVHPTRSEAVQSATENLNEA